MLYPINNQNIHISHDNRESELNNQSTFNNAIVCTQNIYHSYVVVASNTVTSSTEIQMEIQYDAIINNNYPIYKYKQIPYPFFNLGLYHITMEKIHSTCFSSVIKHHITTKNQSKEVFLTLLQISSKISHHNKESR